MEKAFIAAVKRRDVKELVALTLEIEGKPEQAKEIRDASRLTDALIARTCIDEVETDLEITEPEVETPTESGYPDVSKALKKGKFKKALKLIKKLEESGSRGSVLKALKREANEGAK